MPSAQDAGRPDEPHPKRSPGMSTTPIDDTNFTTTLSVDQTPEEVFRAITDVRGWWSQNIDGGTEKVGDEFTYRHRDLHRCTIRVTASMTGKRVCWLVVD